MSSSGSDGGVMVVHARRLGVRVLTFSLGFGPKILKFKRGDTEYCISAVPLGGYVKLAGETVDAIEKEIRRMAEEGPTQKELDEAKSYLKGSQMLALLSQTLNDVPQPHELLACGLLKMKPLLTRLVS